MSISSAMPNAVATVVNDMLDCCAEIQPGQNVLIVGAIDGLHGGHNVVDEQTLTWIQEGVQLRGAHPAILWLDMPHRPERVWSASQPQTPGWRLPKIFREAVGGADVFINHCVDLSMEEELKEVAQVLREHNVPMVRNMATTAPLMASVWAQTPYELVSELRFQAASMLEPGLPWTLTHPNGTSLKGTIGQISSASRYASRRTEGIYRPFPEGVFPALTTRDAEGTLVFEGTNPIWARHIGVPPEFETPIRVRVEGGQARDFEGGSEAETLRGFYAHLAKQLGDAAYQIRGVHGGVHPYARVSEHQCPDPTYRTFIEHHHWSSVHVHIGNSHLKADFPYNVHVTAEVRGATLKVGDNYVWKDGHLGSIDHPEVLKVAARYPDRPGLATDLWG
jgi:hypothetical protein